MIKDIFQATELADYYRKLQRAIQVYKENNQSFELDLNVANYHRKIRSLRLLKAHVLATTVNELAKQGSLQPLASNISCTP